MNKLRMRVVEPHMETPIQNKFRAKKLTQQKDKHKHLRETILCECGNKIRMFNTKKEVKCFSCNHYLRKEAGKWTRDNYKADVVTLQNGGKVVKRGNKVVIVA